MINGARIDACMNAEELYNFVKIFRIIEIFTLPNGVDGDIIKVPSTAYIDAGGVIYGVIYDSDINTCYEYGEFVSAIDKLSNGNMFCMYKKNNERLLMMYYSFDDVCRYVLRKDGFIKARIIAGNLMMNDTYEVKVATPLGTEILTSWYQGFNSKNETFGAFTSDGPLVTKIFTEGVKS